MRILSFIFVLIFAIGVSAQSPTVTGPYVEGTRFANAGKFEKALSSYQTALEDAKGERAGSNFLARLHYNLGVCNYRLNRYENAIGELKKAISLRSKDYADAYYALGMAETARENWPQAQLAFIEALKGKKANSEAWFDLGVAYVSESKFELAEAAFRDAIAGKSVDLPLSYNNIGVILALRGDLSAAIEHFEKAIKTSDDRLPVAKSNLEYCRRYQTTRSALLATTEIVFTNRGNTLF